VLADRAHHADPAVLAMQPDVEAVLCLGDLDPDWIVTLQAVRIPKIGVYGNHDSEPYMDWYPPPGRRVTRLGGRPGSSMSSSTCRWAEQAGEARRLLRQAGPERCERQLTLLAFRPRSEAWMAVERRFNAPGVSRRPSPAGSRSRA
jgi:hypothetical protein